MLHIDKNVVGDLFREDRTMRIRAFHRTFTKAKKGEPVLGATNIAKLTDDPSVITKLYTLLSDDPGIAEIDDFSSKFAIWKGPAVVIDLGSMRRGVARPFMSRRNFASSYAHMFVDLGQGRKSLPDLLWFLSSTTRVDGLTFNPSKEDLILEEAGVVKINEWTGFGVKPHDEEVKDKEIQPFLDYMKNVVTGGDENQLMWVMAWCADIFKFPSDKCGTALVLVGEEGVGKSVLGHLILGRIIGDNHYAASNSVENFTRNFNVAFSRRLLVQCDEAMTNRQKTQAARLKSLITDPHQLVEPKGVDPYFLPLHTRLLFTSNDVEDAVYMASGAADRRYTVIEVPPVRKNDINYWEPFVRWLEKDGSLAKIHRYLRDYVYDRRLIRRPLDTAARRRMQQANSAVAAYGRFVRGSAVRTRCSESRITPKNWNAFQSIGLSADPADSTSEIGPRCAPMFSRLTGFI